VHLLPAYCLATWGVGVHQAMLSVRLCIGGGLAVGLGNVCLDAIWREDGCRSGVKRFGIFSSDCADE
jgi:hypothetical protein